jgi:hypothetical protein
MASTGVAFTPERAIRAADGFVLTAVGTAFVH